MEQAQAQEKSSECGRWQSWRGGPFGAKSTSWAEMLDIGAKNSASALMALVSF